MRITQEVDYGLRVILYLSALGVGEKVEAKVISQTENIPHRFLLKLLRKLTACGIIKSFRGVTGGYALNKEPKDITLYDIVVAIDGPIYVNRCLYDPANCNLSKSSTCTIHKALGKIQSNLIKDLRSVTFDKLLNSETSIL